MIPLRNNPSQKASTWRLVLSTPLLGVTSLLLVQAPFAQQAPTQAPATQANTELVQRMPEDDKSGWLRVELAVVVDASDETLTSERWPLFPRVEYPPTYRWLLDPQYVDELRVSHPYPIIHQEPLGTIILAYPDPQVLIAAEREAQLAAQASDDLPIDAISTDVPTNGAIDESQDQSAVTVVLETAIDTRISVDSLNDLPQSQPIPSGVAVTSLPPDQDSGETAALAEPLPPPLLPRAFQKRSLEDLAVGISSLLRDTGEQLVVDIAWLQPPEASNIPILLDTSGDTESWPPLQGFVDIRRGQDLRLGINLWWNTLASHRPAGLATQGPPRAASQLRHIDADSARPLTIEEANARQEQLQSYKRSLASDLLEPVLDVDTLAVSDSHNNPGTPDTPETHTNWPWDHLIHLADTKALSEGTVRYFDHPIIKVFSTYRELTWGEVYSQGVLDHGHAALAPGEGAVGEGQDVLDIDRDGSGGNDDQALIPSGILPPEQRSVE